MHSIIKMSEGTAIALHSMIYIKNKKDSPVSVKEISEKFEISANHLSKILQRLTKAGYLTSEKGPKGGFRLVKDKEKTTFLDIYKTIEGELQFSSCLFDSMPCKGSKCIMGDLLPKVNKEFLEYFSKTTISDF